MKEKEEERRTTMEEVGKQGGKTKKEQSKGRKKTRNLGAKLKDHH
jgi:hypothetical protein